jgi:hypothetical protein
MRTDTGPPAGKLDESLLRWIVTQYRRKRLSMTERMLLRDDH